MYQFKANGGFGMMHQATKRRLIESAKQPKPPRHMQSGSSFKMLDHQIEGFWVGVETGPGVSGAPYFNGWIYMPELKDKAWQQISSPEKTEKAAIQSIEKYIQKRR